MATVLRLAGKIRVMVYSNDHPPAHAHAVRPGGGAARFELNCPDGPVRVMDSEGFRIAELNRTGAAIAGSLATVCATWRRLHG